MKKFVSVLMILCLMSLVVMTGCGGSGEDALTDRMESVKENAEEQAGPVVKEEAPEQKEPEETETAGPAVTESSQDASKPAKEDPAEADTDAVNLPEPVGEKVPVDAATRKKMN
ncbi:MAG: hypothetical protein IJU25_03175, partial [Lachnospiraceae bacterium]|nr:hypothetical protein [Lachnospiraceae bacterium]